MIVIGDKSFWRTSDVIKAGRRLHDRNVTPGVLRVKDIVAGHDHVGYRVMSENVSAPGQTEFLSLERIAELSGMPPDVLALFLDELAEIRREPDNIGGRCLTMNGRERFLRQPLADPRRLPAAVFRDEDGNPKELPALPETHLRQGREDRTVARVNAAPPIRHVPTIAEKRAKLVAEIERLDAIEAGAP